MTNYEKNSSGAEYYSVVDGKQQYCVNINGHQYYAKDVNRREFYAVDENRQNYYARDASKNQYYVKSNHRDIPITHEVGGKQFQIYAISADLNQIYPKNVEGSEYLLKKNNVEYCAKDKSETGIHPKTKYGVDYMNTNLGKIKLSNGKTKALIGPDQRPIYQKLGKNEVYPRDDDGNSYFYKNRKYDEVYAKKKWG
ncbi:hypothetical protein JTE90_020604 [Oedothorax gibbosus]|uniref:Uncharacterized protein n=1 Tax=Oedothorax gibbosus TaxID=931172 RepID=A0AAV6TTF1_9ARAC|nr:hypothetical protein JTE90_020604 [Oedothorax gibbosus]